MLGEGLWSQMLGTGRSGADKGEDMCGSWRALSSKQWKSPKGPRSWPPHGVGPLSARVKLREPGKKQ